MSRSLLMLMLMLLLFVAACVVNGQETSAVKPMATKTLDFDKTGPQVGDELPELNLRNTKGEMQRLSDAWRGGPALLVTSSLTCPKSRSRWPELKKLVDKYEDQLNIVIVYVIEAHPVGSVCPYKGVEDITPENERDGILRKQPKTLEDRLELAQEFKRYLRIATPIYIDNMQDQAWQALGGAPNLALLVDENGHVVARQGWFSGEATGAAIDAFLAAEAKAREARQRKAETRDRDADSDPVNRVTKALGLKNYEISSLIYGKDTTELASALKRSQELANLVYHPSRQPPTTLLMEAISQRNFPAVELLLAHGANVRARTPGHDSPLQVAAQRGDLALVTLLLKHGADPAFPRSGASPLHEALIGGYCIVGQALVDAGAPLDIFAEIALGDITAVQTQLDNNPSLVFRPDGAGRMPLDYAAVNGQYEIARLLLARGAPVVDDLIRSHDPPLHRAIRSGDVQMVELLLAAGSSPNTQVGYSNDGGANWTPALHLAISYGDLEIVQRLLARKVDLEARDTYSQTALHRAASTGETALVAALIEAGADVHALQLGFSLPCGSGEEETPSNNTPLHLAAAAGNPETIKRLIAAGAKLEARNVHGVTPLLATFDAPLYTSINEESRLENIKTLLAAGANINARSSAGATILDLAQAAARKQQPRISADMLAIGALLRQQGAQPGSK